MPAICCWLRIQAMSPQGMEVACLARELPQEHVVPKEPCPVTGNLGPFLLEGSTALCLSILEKRFEPLCAGDAECRCG